MSLRDFMQQLQEEDEQVIYSKPAEEHIQIIPPVKADNKVNTDNIKVIPPKETESTEIKAVRFKLKPLSNKIESSGEKMKVIIPPKKEAPKPTELNYSNIKNVQEPVSYENSTHAAPAKNVLIKNDVEQLFLQSETSENKKDRWMFYYKKAQESKKSTAVVQKMKRGRFRVKEDSEIILEPKDDEGILKLPPDVDLLPDFITYKKTVGQILQQKWLKK